MPRASYRKLQIWTKAMTLAGQVYQQSLQFTDQDGLASHIRHSAIAIPSKIADGSQRASDEEFAHLVLKAKGMLAQLQTQLLLARELDFLTEAKLSPITIEIQQLDKMLYEFASKLTSVESLARSED